MFYMGALSERIFSAIYCRCLALRAVFPFRFGLAIGGVPEILEMFWLFRTLPIFNVPYIYVNINKRNEYKWAERVETGGIYFIIAYKK